MPRFVRLGISLLTLHPFFCEHSRRQVGIDCYQRIDRKDDSSGARCNTTVLAPASLDRDSTFPLQLPEFVFTFLPTKIYFVL